MTAYEATTSVLMGLVHEVTKSTTSFPDPLGHSRSQATNKPSITEHTGQYKKV